jgi:hypothetical protein
MNDLSVGVIEDASPGLVARREGAVPSLRAAP